jgi:hypothetical protein
VHTFEVGELVVPKLKFGITSLLLWRLQDNQVVNNIVETVKKDCVLTIVKSMPMTNNQLFLNDEWMHGAYLLLTPNGKLGCSGGGWLKKLPTCSNSQLKSIGRKRYVDSNGLCK